MQDCDKESSESCSLNEDILDDLERQLDQKLSRIINRYSSYVNCIREILESRKLAPKTLSTHLLTVSAFNHSDQKRNLLSTHEAYLMEETRDLKDIFNLLAKEYASFLKLRNF